MYEKYEKCTTENEKRMFAKSIKQNFCCVFFFFKLTVNFFIVHFVCYAYVWSKCEYKLATLFI